MRIHIIDEPYMTMTTPKLTYFLLAEGCEQVGGGGGGGGVGRLRTGRGRRGKLLLQPISYSKKQ